MPDDHAGPTFALSATGILAAIDALRNETREARHAQANATQTAIAGLRLEMDTRLRAIEKTLDTSNPTSLGPRINDLERWQSRADADAMGGLPVRVANLEKATHPEDHARVDELEDWHQQMAGSYRAVLVLATALGIVATILGISAYFGP